MRDKCPAKFSSCFLFDNPQNLTKAVHPSTARHTEWQEHPITIVNIKI